MGRKVIRGGREVFLRSGFGDMPRWLSYKAPRSKGANIMAKEMAVMPAIATKRRGSRRGARHEPTRYAKIAGA